MSTQVILKAGSMLKVVAFLALLVAIYFFIQTMRHIYVVSLLVITAASSFVVARLFDNELFFDIAKVSACVAGVVFCFDLFRKIKNPKR